MKTRNNLARLMRMSPIDHAQKNLALRKRMEKLMKLDPATTAKVLAACREGGTMPPAEAARYDAAMRKDEKDFQAAVVKEAKRLLWKVYHTTNSRKSDPGWPDLTFCRERVIFAELKTETGRTSAAQDAWLDALRAAGAEVYLWRPADMAAILRVLA